MALFEARSMVRRFGATLALDSAHLSVEPGEVHALMGENGSGKSTLMRLAAGVMNPESGEMLLNGDHYAPRNPMEARRLGVSMIHQELSICGDLSVAENILLGVEPVRAAILDRSKMRQIALDALAQVGHGMLDPDSLAKDLPVALKQLVEIARAVAAGSRLVIFDEPTSSLTKADVERLFAVVAQLKASGVSVIYISHFLEEIHRIADRVTILRDGQTVASGPIQEFTDAMMVRHMVGRPIEDMYPRSARSFGETTLSASGLAGAKASPFKEASLEVRKGEIFGIAGLNGSGRTEMLRAIVGLDERSSGQVKPSPAQMGMLSEDRKEEGLFLNLSIAENITMTRLGGWRVNAAANAKLAQTLIEKLRIKCHGPNQAVGELSGGNQQKVAIARLIHQGAEIFLLDEPTKGIDVGSKQQIYGLLDELAGQGKTILMVSSYLPEVLGICDRIAVMREGRLLAPVEAQAVTQEDLLELAVG